jgi:hypothetical protein
MDMEWAATVFDSLKLEGSQGAAAGQPRTPPQPTGESDRGGVPGWYVPSGPWSVAAAAAAQSPGSAASDRDIAVRIGVGCDQQSPIRLTLLALNERNYPF